MEIIWWLINVIVAAVIVILGIAWLSEKIDKHYEKKEKGPDGE